LVRCHDTKIRASDTISLFDALMRGLNCRQDAVKRDDKRRDTPMKKSEKIEVRLAPEIKRDFLAHCRRGGLSASEKLRDLIVNDATLRPRRETSPAARTALRVAGSGVLLFGVICLAATALAASGGRIRLGLVVYMISQGLLDIAIAAAMFRAAWKELSFILAASGLLAVVYASEVNPPAPLANTLLGVLIGGAGLHLALALIAALAWTIDARQSGRFKA